MGSADVDGDLVVILTGNFVLAELEPLVRKRVPSLWRERGCSGSSSRSTCPFGSRRRFPYFSNMHSNISDVKQNLN